MPNITLPDGSVREFDAVTTGAEIAASIGKSLARDAVALRVDGEMIDLTRDIETDVAIEIITRDSEDGLELLRHDAAHVLAEAVKELWPDTQVTIGPAIENGFYYDFAREEPFTEDDLAVIETRMQEIVDRDEDIVQEPRIAEAPLAALQPPGVIGAELPAPLPHGFVRHDDAPLGKEILDITEAQAVSVIQPNGVADDVRRKAMPQIAGSTRIHPGIVPRRELT